MTPEPFLWSPNAAHAVSLFAPWQPGDGHPPAALDEAGRRLGVPLPALLRGFWLSWGRRDDMGQRVQYLLTPEELAVHAEALIFCVENQGVLVWGVRVADLARPDPPVSVASVPDAYQWWPPCPPDFTPETVPPALEWQQSHAHLSTFLDVLCYHHAFANGARYGGHTESTLTEEQIATIAGRWRSMRLEAHIWGPIFVDAPMDISVGPGVALAVTWDQRLAVAAGHEAALREVEEALGVRLSR